jgi:hypothetical protein
MTGKSIEEILAVAEDPEFHRVATARIMAVPQALREEHARLDALLPTLVSDTIDVHPDRVPTAERLAEIETAMQEATIEFRFRSIGHRAWADMLRQHPPTKEQLRKIDAKLDHDPETFPYEAMAASCIDPVMTAEDVRRLERSALVDVNSWTELWGACLRANVVDAVPNSLAASLILRQNGESARRRTTTEPPAPSSSDE